MRGVLLGLVLVAACGKGESRSRAAGDPPPGEARVSAHPVDAAAVDATSAASVMQEAPAPVVLDRDRTLRVEQPLRGWPRADAPVFVARGDDPAAAIRRALDDLRVKVPTDRRVVILANAGGYDRIKKGDDNGLDGRLTEVGFTRALLLELRARGVRELAVASGASTSAAEVERAVEVSGYRAMLDELAVPFLDLSHYGEGDTRPAPWRMELPWARHLERELVLSNDLVDPAAPPYLIVVPKIKTHRFAVMTMSIKNLMGAVMIADGGSTAPWQRRWRMHRELAPWMKAWKARKADDRATYRRALAVFSERLAELYGALTPDLVLLEGFPAMQGDGFARVEPYGGAGILIASTNGVYADYVGAEFFGLHDSDDLERELGVRMPPAISAAAERFYGGAGALEHIVVRGDVAWRSDARRQAWFKALAPFELRSR